jgi:hypothetical protein
MGASAKGQMAFGSFAIYSEVIGVGSEFGWIVICGRETHHDAGARWDVKVSDLGLDRSKATMAEKGAVEAQDLLRSVRYQVLFS